MKRSPAPRHPVPQVRLSPGWMDGQSSAVSAVTAVTAAASGSPRRLNFGCGTDLRPGWTNLDICDYGGNTVCDLNRYPWPFPDDYFDEVYASHVLEHMANFNLVITELWRVCRPGARIEVRVPFFLSTKFYSEPDHRIPFGIRSFDNYEDITGRRLRFYEKWKLGQRTNYQSPARFTVVSKRFHMSNFTALRWLNGPINLEPVFYERFFATWLTPEEVWFELRVSKPGPAGTPPAGR